ncbi:MAG: CCA tRNA nucleotidyltransferase [Candidatus Korobacteraceae bacterium]
MPSPAQSAAVEIVHELREHGHQAYLVGGCVRDLVLGREPADFDVATDATPAQVMRIFPETWAVGAQFGVVLVPIHSLPGNNQELEPGQNVVEVATFRSDGVYSDGRHPDQVTYSTDPREDVQRRDFTINGMLLDPTRNEVLDFVGGRADLQAGIIRTIGAAQRRFAEDKLRMMRAVRFAARFGYQIEAETFAAIQALRKQIHSVSRERIREELTRMLTEGQARRAFELLDESGLLREVLPEIADMKGVEQPPQFHPEGDVWVHTLLMLEKLPQSAPKTLAWGVLLHDVGKPPTFRVAPDRIRFDGHVEAGVRMTHDICQRLRFSNDDTEQIAALVAHHMRFADAPRMKSSTFKKFVRLPRFEEHLELHRIDCLSSHANLANYNYVRDQIAAMPPEEIRPQPLVTGRDLIGAGYEPGPRFKEILNVLEDAQLEGRVRTRDEAMQLVLRDFPADRAIPGQ